MRPVSAPLLALLLFHSAQAFDNTPDFPYQANVGSDNVLVRSGPGGRYYPTGRLKTGDQVTVHRHDPGGWFMVSPPEGSFSWIPASGVQISGTTATVTAVSLAVHVGSRFDDSDRNVISRELSKGETAKIIGHGSDADGKPLLKIAPPRLAFRWVSGGVLVPLAHPTTKPTAATQPSRHRVKTALVQHTTSAAATATRKPTPIDQKPYDALKTLDANFGRIASGPPANWSFDQLEADYRKLMQSTSIPGFGTLIRRRLAAVTRYRTGQQTLNQIGAMAKTEKRPGTEAETENKIQQVAQQVARPISRQAKPVPQFTGAGIVRPVGTRHPRLPSFVLVAPDGRLLAFLRTRPGINLAAWVNRSVGLTGPRRFDSNLQSDLLMVESLQAVRLR